MLLKKEIEPVTEDALLRVYAIVDRVLDLKDDPRYMPSEEDLNVLDDLKQKLVASSELIRFTHFYLEYKMKKAVS